MHRIPKLHALHALHGSTPPEISSWRLGGVSATGWPLSRTDEDQVNLDKLEVVPIRVIEIEEFVAECLKEREILVQCGLALVGRTHQAFGVDQAYLLVCEETLGAIQHPELGALNIEFEYVDPGDVVLAAEGIQCRY